MKKCPFCAEEIQDAAIVCKHCGRELKPAAAAPAVKLTPRWKKWLGGIIGVWIALVVIGAIFNMLTGGSSGAANSEPLSGPTADELYAQYRDNEVSADQSFKGRRVMITGLVSDIGKEIRGRPYVTFAIKGNRFNHVQAVFASESAVAAMSKGDEVTVICTVDGKMLGNVIGSNCSKH